MTEDLRNFYTVLHNGYLTPGGLSNELLLTFSDVLRDAACSYSGKYSDALNTQSDLVCAGLRLADNLTARERDILQLPTQLTDASRNSLRKQYSLLREQFLSELFCGQFMRTPDISGIHRGVIYGLMWRQSSQELVLPDNLFVLNSLAVSDCNLRDLPKGLYCVGVLGAGGSRLRSLPEDLCVQRELFLQQTPFTREAALRIPTMNGLSTLAKVTALRSLDFFSLADQVERDARMNGGHSRHNE